MNKIIFDMFVKEFQKTKTKLLLSSLSYYAILALIPTLSLTTLILKFFEIPLYLENQEIFDSISINLISNILVSIVTIYMISRIFLIILKDKFSTIKSYLLSFAFSILLIIFLTLFLTSFTLTNNWISFSIKFLSVSFFLFLIIKIISKANYKYSLLFSLSFSLISNIFFYIFFIIASFFINYENYYGILAPIFLIILVIHILIFLFYTAFIGAEIFTKISNIKIVKC